MVAGSDGEAVVEGALDEACLLNTVLEPLAKWIVLLDSGKNDMMESSCCIQEPEAERCNRLDI